MNVSSFFQGAALKFRLDGEGVILNPETGELGVTAKALSAGFTVLVTARSADGTTEQSFRLKLAAEPSESAPVLLTAPELKGSGLVGEALEVVPGSWGGSPAPAIALQWLRDDAEIAGETGARYVPGAADDGREITCRVTAENAAGALTAEPEPIRVTRAAPTVVDVLADVSVEKGAAAVSVAAAAVFAGEGLRFAVAGAGATIDPATGVLSLPTDVVRAGELVTVTASNSGGAAEASFLVTVAAPSVLIGPSVVTAPALKGTAQIGSELKVEAGLWSGLPLPVLALQWLRDGAEIPGATAAAYVPQHADDRCALRCRVTGSNSVGRHAVETASLTATHVAPTLVGELLDEIFDQEEGSETIATAQVFAGQGLSFAATGAGVAIDATGVLTVSTAAPLSGEVVVTATNSGGSAEARFFLTVEATAPAAPGYIRPALVEFKGVPAAQGGVVYSDSLKAYIQRARLVLKAGIVIPKTHELLLIRSLTSTPDKTWLTKVQATAGLEAYDGSADATWDSGGGGADGVTQYLFLYWRELESGTVTEALEIPANFISVAPAPSTGGGSSGSFRAADQILSAANLTGLNAALAARIASGSSAEWIIDLPNGNYGNLDLQGKVLPGKTILRSQNQNLGAKFGWINLYGCKNITFQLVDADATLRGSWNDHNVAFISSEDCGIEYSRIYAGPIIPTPSVSWGPLGSRYNIRWNVRVDNSANGGQPKRIRIHMNLIEGVCEKAIYHNASIDGEVSDNVFANVGGDQMYVGWGSGNKYLRNWGSRLNYPSSEKNNPSDPYDHGDFFQTYSPTVNMTNYTLIGNVYMVASGNATLNHPHQGIFGSKSLASGWLYQDNIVCNNSYHGISITGETVSNMTALNNTVLRCIDMPGDQHITAVSVQGGVNLQRNVQCNYAGNTSMGSGGLNIPMTNTDHTASLAYYTAPYMGSSFYDLRPVTGKVTHWAYSGGTPIGAHKRFYDVIVGGAYPKIGPAATAWKTWYDPKNQINS